MKKLKLVKADKKEIKEIVHTKKVIEFKEIEKMRYITKEKNKRKY